MNGQNIPKEVQDRLQQLCTMTPGERYDVLSDLARMGFVIMITLRSDSEGNIIEGILFKTPEEENLPTAG